MKVFVSADIEGTTGIADWNEAKKSHEDYKYFSRQMSLEVKAACEGAMKAGTTEILVKDAHSTARNIDPYLLPDTAKIIRGWARDPFMMMQGLNDSFDAVLFTGYHSPSGSGGNPLSHTMDDTEIFCVKINGALASEFLINSYTAGFFGVPVVFVSGDENLTEIAIDLIPSIRTVATNEGQGSSVLSSNPQKTTRLIEKVVYAALSSDLDECQVKMPEKFEVEITYVDHRKAYKFSFFPGVEMVDDRTLRFSETNYYEILRKFLFLL